MNVIAKVRITSIKTTEGNYQGKPVIARSVDFQFVGPSYDKDPKIQEENSKFWDATPSGTLSMYINNPNAAKEFEVGKHCYVTFSEAPSPLT